MLNQDVLQFGSRYLPAASYCDALSAAVSQAITETPLILARALLQSAKDVERIMLAFTVSDVLYSLLLLFAIRMSPQLHVWLYGYAP